MKTITRLSALTVSILALSACATKPATTYYWGSYEPEVYEHFKGEGTSNADQILALEKTVQRAHAANKPLPPGFNAHLGMLYGAEGQFDKMKEAFLTEKQQYPESSQFIDSLLVRMEAKNK